jgi:hypothetical protein
LRAIVEGSRSARVADRLIIACTQRHTTTSGREGRSRPLVVEHDGEQGVIDLEPVRIVDEPEPLEFLHEEIHAGPRCAHHFRKGRLGNEWDGPDGLVVLAVPREQQQRPGQPLFARAEELIDQVWPANITSGR